MNTNTIDYKRIIEIIIMFIPLHSVYVLAAYVIVWLSWDNGNLLAFWKKWKIKKNFSAHTHRWERCTGGKTNDITQYIRISLDKWDERWRKMLYSKNCCHHRLVQRTNTNFYSNWTSPCHFISFCRSRTSHTHSKWIVFRMNDKYAY